MSCHGFEHPWSIIETALVPPSLSNMDFQKQGTLICPNTQDPDNQDPETKYPSCSQSPNEIRPSKSASIVWDIAASN